MSFIIISFYLCCLIDARQWWFLTFVRRVFVSKISSNSVAFKWLTPTHVRTNFFNQIDHILLSFASYCPLLTRPNIVAQTSSSTSSLSFSSNSWAWRHTSWCVDFSCSTAKGTASKLWSTFHILRHFFGWLSGDKAKCLWLFALGETKPEYRYTPYVNRTDQKGQCKKAARGN